MEPRPNASWDRNADLERIRETYAGYSRDHRERLWDRSAPGYARLVEELDTALGRHLREAVAQTPSATVVDLGCGTGDLAAIGTEVAERWIGVDLRPDALATARERHPEVEFLEASADAVPLDAGTVDAVVARVLFSSLPSPDLEQAVAAEIARLLRPGGSLIWLDIRYSNPRNPEVHGMSGGRLRELFDGWERHLHSVGLLPPIARRIGRLTPIVYPMLTLITPMRSHLVGSIKRPADAAR